MASQFPFLSQAKLRDRLNLDAIAKYSMTPYPASALIAQVVGKKGYSVLDMFGGSGMDAIAFLLDGATVLSFEKDASRAHHLQGNIDAYITDGQVLAQNVCVMHADSVVSLLRGELSGSYDVVYIDPPWGGPNYKKYMQLNITINDMPLATIVSHAVRLAKRVVALKVPFNQDLSDRVFNNATVYDLMRDGRNKPLFKLVLVGEVDGVASMRMRKYVCEKVCV